MAKPNFLLFLSLCLLVLSHNSLARQQKEQQSECQLDSLTARKPDNRYEFEAGVTESWDPNRDDFQCAGVAVFKRTIEPNGLLLPSYTNAPHLMYIVQGTGVTGALFPGCPETFQESQGARRSEDQHQRIVRFREGDVLAFPPGVAHWCFNDGKEPVVAVSLLDIRNSENQLDFSPRNFFLAGNPEDEFESQGRRQRGRRSSCNSVFCGFDARFLAEAFNVDEGLARRLQMSDDKRGNIVKVKDGLRMVSPPTLREEERQQSQGRRPEGSENGVEETFCTRRFRENINDPSSADVFTPEAGRLRSLDSQDLPILQSLRLSAERGVLYRDAMMLPLWNLNAHSVIYATRGEARVQVVDHSGQTLFDGNMREGQVLTVPQNFAVVKRTGNDRFEWVAFRTNDNAMFSPFAGRTSAIRAMPAEVLANAFRISVDEARRIKFSREETSLASRRSSQSGSRDVA